jgi:hypothetical protein
MSIKNKLVLYKSVVLPTMTYASAAWGHVSDAQLHKLQVIQNQFLRRTFNAPWFVRNDQLHREAKVPMLKELLLEIAQRTFEKVKEHENPLVREAVDYDEAGPSRCKRPKTVLNG